MLGTAGSYYVAYHLETITKTCCSCTQKTFWSERGEANTFQPCSIRTVFSTRRQYCVYCDNTLKQNHSYRTKRRGSSLVLNDTAVCTPLYPQLRRLCFPDFVIFQKAVVMYKTMPGQTPNYISSLFHEHQSSCWTRSALRNDLSIPRPHTLILL